MPESIIDFFSSPSASTAVWLIAGYSVLRVVWNFMVKLIPELELIKSKIYTPLAKWLQFRSLEKKAIKSDIEGTVNKSIRKANNFLPTSWMKSMKLEWVDKTNRESFLKEGKIVVRLRPLEQQDENFSNALYYFFKGSFFPRIQSVLPNAHIEASVVYWCRSIIGDKKRQQVFENEIMEPLVQKHKKIPDYLEDYSTLNDKGLFSGLFLRELDLSAHDVRFSSNRKNIPQEISNILKHLKSFSAKINNKEKELSEADWFNVSGFFSYYGILLVASPVKVKHGVDAYFSRAMDHANSGAKRLYVFGAKNERYFAKKVIKKLNSSEAFSLIEEFETPYDYRGNKNGIGAVFDIT